MAWIKKFLRSEKGNMAVIGALASGVLIMMSGAAIDATRLYSLRQSLQEAADTAAIIAAVENEKTAAERQVLVNESVGSQPVSHKPGVSVHTPSVNKDADNEVVSVQLEADVTMYMGALFGKSSRPVKAQSMAAFGGNSFEPMTVMFVLDASGSMNAKMQGKKRIRVLEDTVQELFIEVEDKYGDDTAVHDSLRTGMYAYAWYIHTESTQNVAPGWNHVTDNVDNLRLSNGTIPALAMEEALAALLADKSGEGVNHKQFLVFMTDGEVDDHLTVNGDTDNTGRSFTQRTLDVCQQAKENDIVVIGIGMQAPSSGRDILLQCASPDSGLENYGAEEKAIDQKCASLNAGSHRQECLAAKVKYFSNNGQANDFKIALAQAFPQSQPVAIRIIN